MYFQNIISLMLFVPVIKTFQLFLNYQQHKVCISDFLLWSEIKYVKISTRK